MKKILVPISFSEGSRVALRQASFIAGQTGASLSLLHCFHAQPYARAYDFGKEDYAQGIKKMMWKFYTESLGDQKRPAIEFITHPGDVSKILQEISAQFDLLILGRKPNLASGSQKWFSEKTFYFSTKSLCPVLLTSSDQAFSFSDMKLIWHIKRAEQETKFVSEQLQKLSIDPRLVVIKSLQQKTFVSTFWKKIATYANSHNEDTLKDLDKSFKEESIDLLVLVNHRKGLFESFVRDDAFRLIRQFNITILIV